MSSIIKNTRHLYINKKRLHTQDYPGVQLSNVATMPLTEAFIDNIQHNYLVVDKERQLHWCLKQQNVSNYIPFL